MAEHSFQIDFSNQVVIVTGGSRGIGRAIAEAFLDTGAHVVVCARKSPATLPHAHQSAGSGGHERTALFIEADVRDADQVKQMVDETVSLYGRVDVLINNAGGSPSVAAAEASPRFVRSIIELNLLAPFFCAQAVNAVMQQQSNGGVIVNMGSVSGSRPSPGTAAYGAAKAGLASLTSTLAVEWAPKVRVNCIIGGLIATDEAESHYGGAEGLAAVASSVPMNRMGTPEDIAGLCLMLASPMAGYVSGSSLLVHGAGERPAYLDALERHLGSS